MAQIRREYLFDDADYLQQSRRPKGLMGRLRSLRSLEVLIWLLCFLTLAVVSHSVLSLFDSRGLKGVITSALDNETLHKLMDWDNAFEDANTVNVLVLGTDATNNLCDTIMVAFVNVASKRAALLSIPRDSRMSIPGQGIDKITHAFPNAMGASEKIEKGIQAVKGAVEQTLGIPIDRYVRVDVAGFEELVDVVGGVELTVEERMHYTDYEQGLFIDLLPGEQRLNGDKALQYVRYRGGPTADLGRVERQQKFLSELTTKLASVGREDPCSLALAALRLREHADTDLSVLELRYLAELVDEIDLAGLETRVAAGNTGYKGEISYYQLDLPQIQRDIEALETEVAYAKPSRLMARVAVLNGCGIDGLAKTTSEHLADCGLQEPTTDDADSYNYATTVVRFKPEHEETAQTVAEVLDLESGALLPQDELEDAAADVEVVLGRDHPVFVEQPAA
jgi:LCP family protein required for cell wall assembly